MPGTRDRVEEQLRRLTEGVVEVLPLDAFRAKLERSIAEGRPLRVKQGFDPTAPDIHLGHSVGLRKLRQFQDLGHTVVLVVGDYTGRVGDPSGRSATRPQLSADTLERNAETYLAQFGRIVDVSRAEIRRNGEWFAPMGFADVIALASKITVARITEREDFAKRLAANAPVALHELLYPLMQGYDSVAIHADVEIGGTEQVFNLLIGRALQSECGQEPQVAMTLPILPGLDGVRRMSKSLGNYVGVAEPPREMYGKLMSLPDTMIVPYLRFVTDTPAEEVARAEREIAERRVNPMDWKKRLAATIVGMYHDAAAAGRAAEEFERQFTKHEVPADAPVVRLPAGGGAVGLKDLLVRAGTAASGSEAQRLIRSGAVSIDGVRLTDVFHQQALDGPFALRVGRRYVRIEPDPAG